MAVPLDVVVPRLATGGFEPPPQPAASSTSAVSAAAVLPRLTPLPSRRRKSELTEPLVFIVSTIPSYSRKDRSPNTLNKGIPHRR